MGSRFRHSVLPGRAARRRAWEFLAGARHPLVLTHERPDGDAFGSLAGLCLLLAAHGRAVTGFLRVALPPRYARLPGLPPCVAIGSLPPVADCDVVVALDCSTGERLEGPPGWTGDAWRARPLLNLDHHADNERFGDAVLVDPRCAATSQLLAEVAAVGGARLPPAAATWFLAGLIMDTGAFQFDNTTPAVLQAAARLTAAGADYAGTMDALFFHEAIGRRRLAARLLETAQFACGGRLVFAVLLPSWLRELAVDPGDTEGLIDVLRTLDGVDLACLVQPEEGGVRLSLRARSRERPVDRMAHALGGGGHALAAGARLRGATLEEATARLCREAERVLGP